MTFIAEMRLRILGIDYEVKEVYDMSRICSATGHFDSLLKEIRIDKDLHASEKQRVILHELLELLNRELDLNLDHNQQINKLDAGLFHIFKDNPQLLKMLLDQPFEDIPK